MYELPVQHESSPGLSQNRYQPQQYSHPYPQQSQSWQSPRPDIGMHATSPPRGSTPPRVGTPPRTMYTQAQDRNSPVVREIPIQHVSTKPPAQNQHQEMPNYTIYTGPQQGGGGQPQSHQSPVHQPQQGYQQFQYPSQQSYPERTGYTQPQTQPEVKSHIERRIPIVHETSGQGHTNVQGHPQQYNVPPTSYQPPNTTQNTPYPQSQTSYTSMPQPDYQQRQPPTEYQQSQRQPPSEYSAPPSVQKEEKLEVGHDEPDSKTEQASTESVSEEPKSNQTIDQISQIVNGLKDLEIKVNCFRGTKKDKEYKFLEEMLTRSLLKLDGIEADGNDEIRQARKHAVREVQSNLDQLELKAFSEEQTSSAPAEENQSLDSQSVEQSKCQESKDTESETNSSQGSGNNNTSNTKVKEMVLDSEVQC